MSGDIGKKSADNQLYFFQYQYVPYSTLSGI